MTMNFSEYEVKTLRFEDRTCGRILTFRNAVGTAYIQYPWIKCSRFVAPDGKSCKAVKDRARIRLPTPASSEVIDYVSKPDDFVNSKEFRGKYGLSSKHECKSKFMDKETMKIKMPIDEYGNVSCKMFEVVWKNSKTPDRGELTDIH